MREMLRKGLYIPKETEAVYKGKLPDDQRNKLGLEIIEAMERQVNGEAVVRISSETRPGYSSEVLAITTEVEVIPLRIYTGNTDALYIQLREQDAHILELQDKIEELEEFKIASELGETEAILEAWRHEAGENQQTLRNIYKTIQGMQFDRLLEPEKMILFKIMKMIDTQVIMHPDKNTILKKLNELREERSNG